MTTASWIAGARAAGHTAGSRADLWPPSALAALAYLGWVPLLVTVAPSIRSSQLILFGAGLVSASLFPWNLLLIATALASFVLLVCALAAVGESAVLRDLGPGAGRSGGRHPDTASIFAVLVVATLPAAIAGGALFAGLAVLAPDVLTSPDQGVPLVARLTTALAPFVIALAAMTLVGQALGAAALRRTAGSRTRIVAALGAGALDVLHRPTRRLGIAFVATLADLGLLVVALVLLGTVWLPIAGLLGAGRFASPEVILRLAGFVLIWLLTVGLMGLVHAWISAWWSIELTPEPGLELPEVLP